MKNLAPIKSFFSSIIPFLAFAGMISNFVVSCCVYRSSHPQYVYSHSEVTNVVYSVVTNYIHSSSSISFSSSSNSPSSSVDSPKSRETRSRYSYSVVSGRRCFRWFSHDYYEGDICSLGLVIRIFPDKVFFHNGDVLLNDSPSIDIPSNLGERRFYGAR